MPLTLDSGPRRVSWPRWRDRLTSPPLWLRRATAEDFPELQRFQEAGTRPYSDAYYSWDSHAFGDSFRSAEGWVLDTGRRIVAFTLFRREPDHLFLAELHVRAEFRSRGLGSALVTRVIREADGHDVPLRLWVLRNNPARKLYLALGFRDRWEAPFHLVMERPVSPPQTSASGPVLSPILSTGVPNRCSRLR